MKIKSLSLLLGTMLLAVSAFADKKDDLYNAAQKALGSGDVINAAKNFCAVSQMDAGYKDAQQNCNIMRDLAAKEEKKNEDRYNEGVKAFESGDLDTAEQKLKNVRVGVHVDEAHALLAKIPGARQAASGAANESVANAKFQEGVSAFNTNNFGAAKSAFSAVTTGAKAGDAQTYLNKIRSYEQAFAEAERLASARNYRAAQQSYQDAANVKGDGPGDPRGKISQMNQLAASNNGGSNSSGGGGGGGGSNPPVAPAKTVTNAVVDVKPKVDVAAKMKEAESAMGKKDYKKAKSAFFAILAVDSHNSTANAGLDEIAKNNAAAPVTTNSQETSGSSEEDSLLATAVGEFYKQNFEDAEYDLRNYIKQGGGKRSLASFYLGAVRLTRYYLNGEQAGDIKLVKSAQDAFREAKKSANFKAPEKFVSPRIIKKFKETT